MAEAWQPRYLLYVHNAVSWRGCVFAHHVAVYDIAGPHPVVRVDHCSQTQLTSHERTRSQQATHTRQLHPVNGIPHPLLNNIKHYFVLFNIVFFEGSIRYDKNWFTCTVKPML